MSPPSACRRSRSASRGTSTSSTWTTIGTLTRSCPARSARQAGCTATTAGTFSDETEGNLPAFRNNYEFAPVDLDADGLLDLVTINDGASTELGLAEHIFRNEGGAFTDATDAWWPPDANPGYDDAMPVPLDIDSDGDADFLVASLDGPDRLLLNDGSGAVSLLTDVFVSDGFTAGTLAIVLADLNGDGRLDAVESEGEVPGHEEEHVYFGTEVLPPDTAAPVVRTDLAASPAAGTLVHARVHDNDAAYAPHLWRSIELRWDGGSAPMRWYGEFLFAAEAPAGVAGAEVCATDAAGNETCVATNVH